MNTRIQYSQSKNCHQICIPNWEGIRILDTCDILFVESDINYSKFHLVDGKTFVSSKTLKHFAQILESCGFYRIHQSYLINVKHAQEFCNKSNTVALRSNHVLPISRQKRQGFRQEILPQLLQLSA